MLRLSSFFCLLFLSVSSNAQTISDALRYSFLQAGGTARSMGLGGSMSAIGGEFATISINPAGLAVYRSSDFMFTPSFQHTNTSSTLMGNGNNARSEKGNNLALDNLGIVFSSTPIASNWKTVNLGIGMNKLANYSQEFAYEGISKGSIVDRFTELANGFSPDQLYPYEEGLAYRTEAIYEIGDNFYGSDFQEAPDADIIRNQEITRSGKYNEMVFALGANYNHKLMMGLTVGVPFIEYEENKVYQEENNEDETIPNFRDLTFEENLRTTGIGINVKLGAIYRINQMFRAGLAFHSPTSLRLTDRWDASLNYDFTFDDQRFDNFAEEPESTPFEYKLTTPMRAILSAGAIIKRSGFISAEVEYVDYAQSKFDLTINTSDQATADYEEILNQEIKDNFTSALNIRLGGEYALKKFRFRAGYGILGTPYANDSSYNSTYSFGLGIRERKFYLDLAYKHTEVAEIFTPYRLTSTSAEQLVNSNMNLNRYILTIGFRF